LPSRFCSSALLASACILLEAAETPDALYRRALESFSGQRYEIAESLLREAVERRPRWFEARFLLGASLVSLGRAAEAIDELKTARRLNPAHLDCAKLLAAEYLGLERASEALAVVDPLMAKKSADEELLLLAIEARHLSGEPGDAEEAMRLCNLGLSRYPKSARLLAWRGYALRRQGAFAMARESLEAALQIAPGDWTAQTLLADVLLREGSSEKALRLFEQVLAHAPADDEALAGKAGALASLGKADEAIAVLETAVRAAPDAPRLRLELSRLYAQRGDRESAALQAAEFRRLRAARTQPAIPAGLRSASSR